MNMLPDAISNVLHREIKRLHSQLESVEDRLASLQEAQYAGMVQVHRGIEKLEMDSEDLQEGLRRCLGNRNPKSNKFMCPPGERPRKSSHSAAVEEHKANENNLEDSAQVRGRDEALEQILVRVGALEKSVTWLYDHHLMLQRDVEWMKKEHIVFCSKHSRELKELQLLVKSPGQSTGTPQERLPGIQPDPDEQPVVQVEDGCESSSTGRFRQQGFNVPGGISRMDHFRQMDQSLSSMVASAKSRTKEPGTSILQATFSQALPFDLDFQSNIKWNSAENKTQKRKSNMEVATSADNQLQTTPRSVTPNAKDVPSLNKIQEVQRTVHLFPTRDLEYESKKEELELDQPTDGLSAVQDMHCLQSEENYIFNAGNYAAQRSMDETAYKSLKVSCSSWNIGAGSKTDDPEPHMPQAVDSGNESSVFLQDENASKTHKVLEAYGLICL